jgi:hypothetical protein
VPLPSSLVAIVTRYRRFALSLVGGFMLAGATNASAMEASSDATRLAQIRLRRLPQPPHHPTPRKPQVTSRSAMSRP